MTLHFHKQKYDKITLFKASNTYTMKVSVTVVVNVNSTVRLDSNTQKKTYTTNIPSKFNKLPTTGFFHKFS